MINDRFEPLTDYYDERVKGIDEQLCALLRERKAISDNPGFPTETLISNWAERYDLSEYFLNGLFGHLFAEKHFQPIVEPKKFLKNIPILKSVTKEEVFYTVSFVRQYENASVVNLTIDYYESEDVGEDMSDREPLSQSFDLEIEDSSGIRYICQNQGGGGFNEHAAFQYVVSPALPEDLSGVKLMFVEEGTVSKQVRTKFEFALDEIK